MWDSLIAVNHGATKSTVYQVQGGGTRGHTPLKGTALAYLQLVAPYGNKGLVLQKHDFFFLRKGRYVALQVKNFFVMVGNTLECFKLLCNLNEGFNEGRLNK